MKQGPALALAGLFLIGAVGCELNRPCGGRCLFAHHGYAESEGYRPKTVVTMRAETLPEAAPAPQGTSTVQLASASAVSASPSGNSVVPPSSAPVVTLTIPAMKIIIPMTAAMSNKGPGPANGTAAVTQLPPAGGMASSNSSASARTPVAASPSDIPVRTAVYSPAEEEPSLRIASPSPPLEPVPEAKTPLPEAKTAADSPSAKKKAYDPLRPSKLSLLPPDPPELLGKGSNATTSDPVMEVPPPPPPIPRKPSDGPSLPSVEPAPK